MAAQLSAEAGDIAPWPCRIIPGEYRLRRKTFRFRPTAISLILVRMMTHAAKLTFRYAPRGAASIIALLTLLFSAQLASAQNTPAASAATAAGSATLPGPKNVAEPQRKLSLRNANNEWQPYPASLNVTGSNLEAATKSVTEIILRSKVALPPDMDLATFQAIADHLFRYSSVDQLDAHSTKLLLYNILADVFSLVEIDGGQIKTIEFASGQSISAALEIPNEPDDLVNLLTQRPWVLSKLKDVLKHRDVSGLFKKSWYDNSEQKTLANNMISNARSMASAPDNPCAEFALNVFRDQQDKILLDSQISEDLKASYRAIMHLDVKDGTIFIFGDTVMARSRTFLLMTTSKRKCKTISQMTLYLTD